VTDIRKVPGVAAVQTPLYLEGEWKRVTKKTAVAVTLAGIMPGNDFTVPEITGGRMVADSDTNKIVISSWFVRDDPSIRVGQTIPLTINDQVYKFEIIGVYMQPNAPMGYVNENYLERVSPDISQISSVQIRTTGHSQQYLNAFAKDVEQQMKKRGYDVAYSLGINSIRGGMQGQFDFLILFLLIMAVMVAVVGGLGLAGTMSLNVLERTREIGVMRSIGASNRSVFQLVVVESLAVGLLSWIISIPLSIPMGYGFCLAIGMAFFEKVLPFSFSVTGIALWLVIVFVISVLASILPARNAVRLTVRDTLSYE
jgi:putative ABC transport system permease protein